VNEGVQGRRHLNVSGLRRNSTHQRVPEEKLVHEYRYQGRVLAVVSPFEGGRLYNYDAVRRIASEMDAEVLRLDLAR
jgi:hypothetical protein